MAGKLTITILLSLLIPQFLIAEQQPIKIGWIGPLTGNAAVLGVDSLAVAEMVFSRVNNQGGVAGRKIELIAEDDEYKTPKSVSAYQKLVHQDNVKAIIVVTYGGLFALADRAERDNVLLIDPLDCDEEIAKLPRNTLCISKRTEDLGYRHAEYAVAIGDKRVGVIYFDGDPFMGTVARSTIDRLNELGAKVVLKEPYLDDRGDFRSILTQAKRKNVEALFFYGYDQMGLAMKQARQLGLKAKFYALNVVSSPGFKDLAGEALEGTLVSRWTAPRNAEFDTFMKDFSNKKGRPPFLEISTIPTYDIANVILKGLKRGYELQKPENLVSIMRDEFYSLNEYKGLSGNITMDKDGITRNFPVRIHVFEKGNTDKVVEKG